VRARDNPFRSDRVLAVRYRLLQGTWEGLFARLEALGFRAAIVGPKGSGKTTLLEDLKPSLLARGLSVRELRLDTESPCFDPEFLEEFFASLTRREVVLFDGAEQLSRVEWARFDRRTRGAGGLLITSHRPGLLPTLLESTTTPELLAGLVDQILGDRAMELRPLLPRLFEQHDGNVREALRELYDRFAAVEG
jgi:hypothetical protein